MPTTATSHRSRATLLDVAKSHASSRALSTETREVFRMLAEGWVPNLTLTATTDTLHDAFFEAATSCATRAGQSYARRCMVSDLMALRDTILEGHSLAPAEYVLQVTVASHNAAAVDTFERALRAFQHAGVTVESVEGV